MRSWGLLAALMLAGTASAQVCVDPATDFLWPEATEPGEGGALQYFCNGRNPYGGTVPQLELWARPQPGPVIGPNKPQWDQVVRWPHFVPIQLEVANVYISPFFTDTIPFNVCAGCLDCRYFGSYNFPPQYRVLPPFTDACWVLTVPEYEAYVMQWASGTSFAIEGVGWDDANEEWWTTGVAWRPY